MASGERRCQTCAQAARAGIGIAISIDIDIDIDIDAGIGIGIEHNSMSAPRLGLRQRAQLKSAIVVEQPGFGKLDAARAAQHGIGWTWVRRAALHALNCALFGLGIARGALNRNARGLAIAVEHDAEHDHGTQQILGAPRRDVAAGSINALRHFDLVQIDCLRN